MNAPEIIAATEPQVTEAAAQIGFEPALFVDRLQYMGIGMLVIFAVIGVIILSTMLINWLFSE